MKTYILTNANWHRGNGADKSYIIPPESAGPDAPRCCLGNVAREEGLQLARGCASASMVHGLAEFSTELRMLYHNGDIFAVYEANDITNTEREDRGETPFTDEQRVEAINYYTREHGFQFEFKANG